MAIKKFIAILLYNFKSVLTITDPAAKAPAFIASKITPLFKSFNLIPPIHFLFL